MIDILNQLHGNSSLQLAVLVFIALSASMAGGIGRIFFMALFAARVGRLALLVGMSGGGLAYFS